jgi:hypothetical protein
MRAAQAGRWCVFNDGRRAGPFCMETPGPPRSVIPRERTPCTLPDHRTRCATEESTFRLLVTCRDAPDWPCLALSSPQLWCGLPRLASRGPKVDSSAHARRDRPIAARPGLGMTILLSFSRVRGAPLDAKGVAKPLSSRRSGDFLRERTTCNPIPHNRLRATEGPTVGRGEAGFTPRDQPCRSAGEVLRSAPWLFVPAHRGAAPPSGSHSRGQVQQHPLRKSSGQAES